MILGHQTSLPPLHSYCKNQSNWKLPSSRLHQMVVLLSLTVFFNMESNFESSWYRLGTGLLPAWYQLGTDMVQAWYYLVPVWSPAWSPAWFHHRRASGVVWNQMDLGTILKPPTLRIEIWEQAHQDAARTPRASSNSQRRIAPRCCIFSNSNSQGWITPRCCKLQWKINFPTLTRRIGKLPDPVNYNGIPTVQL